MDAVITYVDGLDPQWQAQYAATVGMDSFLAKRFRDWGTLKFLLRGIDVNMPFIRRVHLVVSSESQVPSWIDTDQVNIVTHKDIIPAEHLPVFNSTAIEMYLHRISGLDEEYVYFNDDMFPVMPSVPEDFFVAGHTAMYYSRCRLALNQYRRHTRNSDRLARKAAGVGEASWYLRPQHICSPMLRSSCERLSGLLHDEIEASVSALREDRNYNQYLFLDYMYYSGKAAPKRLSNKHISLGTYRLGSICRHIRNPRTKFLCINDVQMTDARFEKYRAAILEAFSELLPDRSRFENCV